ncbi:MAG: hypothetical protein KAR56_03945 [Thermoplasmata archaeon]|nr:hypothetical protein [Thermoplasmata archaeon]
MEKKAEYRETIYWKEIVVILGVFSALFFGMVIRVYMDRPDAWEYPSILFISMGIIFAFLAVNFRKLDIALTDNALEVGWMYPKKVIPWSEIEAAKTDKDSGLIVLGFGIRGTRYEGKWVLVYNVIFAKRAIVYLKTGKVQIFVFSTKQPEKVVGLINANINKANVDGQSDD